MNKRRIRVYSGFADSARELNNEVYFASPDVYALELGQCGSCGELFVIDFENPETKGMTVRDVGDGHICPACHASLKDSLHEYPAYFRARSGVISKAVDVRPMDSADQGFYKEFWELEPAR